MVISTPNARDLFHCRMMRRLLFRRMLSYGSRVFSNAPNVKLKSALGVSLSAAAPFSYNESEAAVPDRPRAPASFPDRELTHEFLVRQSCVLSADSAGTLLTRYMTAVQDAADLYVAASSELAK